MYKDKNNRMRTDGNESIDKLLHITENCGVLSKEFNDRLYNIAIWITTNHKPYIADIKIVIASLKEEMEWLDIFTLTFINKINTLLLDGLEYKILSEEKEKFKI